MNTYIEKKSAGSAFRIAAALLSLVVVPLVAACGEETLEEDVLSLRQLKSAGERDDCPTGTCNDQNNGLGIYVGESFHYCIPRDTSSRTAYVCPERFEYSSAAGGFQLVTEFLPDGVGTWPSSPQYKSFSVTARLSGAPVTVLDISSEQGGELTFLVKTGASETLPVSGAELERLVLGFSGWEFNFEMKFAPADEESGITLYKGLYSSQGGVWQSLCADNVERTVFLPERAVHGRSAFITSMPESTTLACRTGAIATCMVWGYRPWLNGGGSDELYGACLQAKRAAFFAEYGDYTSYTVPGTPLAMHDQAGILVQGMPGVEAIWGPRGAICLSPEYRRISPGDPLPALPANHPLAPCPEEYHLAAQQGTLGEMLTKEKVLATGP
jgi:hypothetical protein